MLQPGCIAVLVTSGLAQALVIPLLDPSLAEDVANGPTTVTLRPFESRPRPTDGPALGEEKKEETYLHFKPNGQVQTDVPALGEEKEEIYLQFKPNGEVQKVDEDWWLGRYGDKSGILKDGQQETDVDRQITSSNVEKRAKSGERAKTENKVNKIMGIEKLNKTDDPYTDSEIPFNEGWTSWTGTANHVFQGFPGKQGKLGNPKTNWDHYLVPGNDVDIAAILDKQKDDAMKAHAQQKAQEFEKAKHDLLKAQYKAAQKSKEIIAAQDAIHAKAKEKADKARIEAEAEESRAIWKAKQAAKTADDVFAQIEAEKDAAKLSGVVYPEDGQEKDKDGLLPVLHPTKLSSYEPADTQPSVQLGRPYVAYHGDDVTLQILDDITKPDDPTEYYRGLSPDRDGV